MYTAPPPPPPPFRANEAVNAYEALVAKEALSPTFTIWSILLPDWRKNNLPSCTLIANSPASMDAVVGILPDTKLRLCNILSAISIYKY